MGKSPAFARIKRDVLRLTLAIPYGRVAACADIAALLHVHPRHVAYILATLSPEEELSVPWYRAVASTGLLLAPQNTERVRRQAALLRAEGVSVTRNFQVRDFHRLRVPSELLSAP